MVYASQKMIIQRSALDSILLTNVVDLRFARRIPKAGFPATRRILCTKSYNLLNSTNGRITLNYKPPRGPHKVNEAADNLLVVWDILMQGYRNISMNQANLITQYPADDSFWTYFNDNIYPMSGEQKLAFMNS